MCSSTFRSVSVNTCIALHVFLALVLVCVTYSRAKGSNNETDVDVCEFCVTLGSSCVISRSYGQG